MLLPDDQLPAVRTLAKELGINPNTVSKAYQECEMLNLTYSIPGKGSYVSSESSGIDVLKETVFKDFLAEYTKLVHLGMSYDEIIAKLKEVLS